MIGRSTSLSLCEPLLKDQARPPHLEVQSRLQTCARLCCAFCGQPFAHAQEPQAGSKEKARAGSQVSQIQIMRAPLKWLLSGVHKGGNKRLSGPLSWTLGGTDLWDVLQICLPFSTCSPISERLPPPSEVTPLETQNIWGISEQPACSPLKGLMPTPVPSFPPKIPVLWGHMAGHPRLLGHIHIF